MNNEEILSLPTFFKKKKEKKGKAMGKLNS